jgi:hypothetical protein
MNNCFKDYKDKHLGERVFIIANGPSLAETDLTLLKDETCIAMNRISLIYDKHPEWIPTYYLFSSTNVKHPDWGRAWGDSIRKSISNLETTSFIAEIFKSWIDSKDRYPHVNWFDSMTEIKPTAEGDLDPSCFSTDIVERIDKSGTSVNLALQMAYWMGFSEIVFVGADLGFTKDEGSKNDPNHFDPSYRAHMPRPDKVNKQMRNVHILAKSYLDKKGVKIYNASKNTTLDTYPIIDLESYMEGRVIRREEEEKRAKENWL